MMASAIHWYVMGAMMIGENPELSPRVKRGLPTTGLGRLLFTWFNPGPGTGYLFAVSNVLGAALLATLGVGYWALQGKTLRGGPPPDQFVRFIVVVSGYLVIYLGVTNLLLRLLRRVAQVTVVSSLLINLLLLLAFFGIPRVIREMTDYRGSGYTFLHITDPFWSCFVTIDPGSISFGETLVMLVTPVAAAVLLLNLIYIAPDVRQVRIAPPVRVEEEDSALAAALHPAQPQPTNPWD
jgi:hypothetical protein